MISDVRVALILVRVLTNFFYGCGGCAVYFVFSTFLLFQIL